MASALLSLKNWINTRHVIIDTKPSLLSSNNEKVLKCLGGVQGCLMLLLRSRSILSDQQCNSIKQAISEIKQAKPENKLIITENNNKEETVKLTFDKLDSNSLCHITHFLTTFEISVSFKNVCSKFAIIGLDEINKYDVFVTKINNIQYKYKYINQPKLFEELLCDNLHNCITLRVPQNMKTKTMFIRYMNKNNINPLHSAIFETHKNNKNEMVPTVNVTTTMFNELSIVNKNINRKNKYLICEYINEISDIKYEQTNDLLLFIKYFDIFEQQLYVKWLLFNKKNSIKQFVQFIISKLILNSNKNNNQYSKYELTNLKSNLLNKCLFYVHEQNNDDLTLTALKLSENQILEDLNIEYLSTIVFQLNPNKLIINYSNLQNEVENKGNFWYNTISNFIESIKQSKTVYIKPYKTTFDEYKQMEETLKTFKILIAPNTTYGVIRKKISHFLNAKNKIKSHNIEIESMEDTFWDTPIPNLDESIIRYDIVLYDVREKHKKCKISMINGDKLMENNNINNILDIGMKSLLNNILIYKDITFKQIFNQWSKQTNIPLQYLIVYYYTERKNKTIRPNCQLKLNLNEEYKNDKNITQQMIKTHTINTKSTQKYIKSIHERIGNILVKKRSFMLFDNRKIATIKNQSVAIDSKRILLALKYFDFFQQKLYFVDWIFINTNTVKFIDIQNYIIKTLIPNAKKERLYFKELNDYISKMNQDKKHETFLFFEEEAVIKDNDDKVIKLHMNNNIDNNYFDGDIFIFQLNPYHSYFNGTNNETLSPQIIKQKSEKKGVYWYDMVNDFMTSQLNMVNIEIKVRENTGWKQQWTNALLLQYKNNNKHVNIDENTRNKITKPEHKWKLEKKTTFGMIRMKLGSYYNINPEYIEIWLPQHTYSYSEKWDYGSKGRGKWNGKLGTLLSDGRHEWNEQCPLKFEIQTYRMQDFDRMTLYNNTCLNTQAYAMMNHTFSKRIKELAMFNFEIIAPNKAKSGCGNMTMSFCKNWTAKQLSNGILKEVIENPIFGYTFFSEIVKYIRENEIDESKSDKYIDDISILKSLSLDRFLICDENVDKLPIQYYMNDKYEMPEHFSQIKYTDFRMQFLAKNDPLVIMNLQNEQKAMEIDMNCKALWVYLEKINAVGGNRYQSKKIRVVLKKGESLKDIIINYLIPYLTLSESFKILNHDKHHNKVADMLIDNILMTHKFKIKGQTNKLTKDEINDSEFAAKLTDKMYLIVWLPRDT